MKNLFVGNMSFQTSESDLRALFEQHGEVTRVYVPTDRDTGRARGFAFVEMASDEEAERAVAALNGKEVDGRVLNINEARPRPERSAPRSGGGGGGGRRSGGYSRDDYRGAARQPREPRW